MKDVWSSDEQLSIAERINRQIRKQTKKERMTDEPAKQATKN